MCVSSGFSEPFPIVSSGPGSAASSGDGTCAASLGEVEHLKERDDSRESRLQSRVSRLSVETPAPCNGAGLSLSPGTGGLFQGISFLPTPALLSSQPDKCAAF